MYINRANRFALASIEVTPKDLKCEQRVISASGDRSARTVYDQTVLLKMGGRSMIETKISHSDSTDTLQAGFYQSALYLPGTFEFVALDDDAYQCQNEYCELLWSEDKVTFSPMLSYLECPNCGSPVVQLSKETPPKL